MTPLPGTPDQAIRRSRARRRTLVAVLLFATLALSGCTRPLPSVSFFGNGAVVSAAPTLWCSADSTAEALDCLATRSDASAPQLTLLTGQGVSVNVPAAIGLAPWVVVFRFRTVAGQEEELRSELFSADARQQYELKPPTTTDQLLRVEVQSGLTPMAATTGNGVDYAALHTWVVLINSP
ncbi:MAG: DUF2771 family protein [Nakamurella sp.]